MPLWVVPLTLFCGLFAIIMRRPGHSDAGPGYSYFAILLMLLVILCAFFTGILAERIVEQRQIFSQVVAEESLPAQRWLAVSVVFVVSLLIGAAGLFILRLLLPEHFRPQPQYTSTLPVIPPAPRPAPRHFRPTSESYLRSRRIGPAEMKRRLIRQMRIHDR